MRKNGKRLLISGILFLLMLPLGIRDAAAERKLKLDRASFFGDDGLETGSAIHVEEDKIYLAGSYSSHGSNLSALALAYPNPVRLGNSPLWSIHWTEQDEKGLPIGAAIFYAVTATPEGIYLAGKTWSENRRTSIPDEEHQSQGVLIKLPRSGGYAPVQWVSRLNLFPSNRGPEEFRAVAASKEETGLFLYLTGSASAWPYNRTAFLAKYNTDGKLEWSRKLSEEEKWQNASGTSAVIYRGFIYIAGYTTAKRPFVQDSSDSSLHSKFDEIPLYATIWKYDAAGKQIWTRVLSDHRLYSYTKPCKVAMAVSGKHLYLAGGKMNLLYRGSDVFITKLDFQGNVVWNSAWGEKRHDAATAIAARMDRILVVGWKSKILENPDFPPVPREDRDAFLLEVDKSYGSILSSQEYGGEFYDEAQGIYLSEEDVFVVGKSKSFNSLGLYDPSQNSNQEGDLMLLQYTGLSPVPIAIDIKPGELPNTISQKSKAKIPVAILSNSDFDATTELDQTSFTFGRAGGEPSLDACHSEDTNRDGLVDLVCDFKNPWRSVDPWGTAFREGDSEGILKGQTLAGEPLIGTDSVRVMPLRSDEELAVPPQPVEEPQAGPKTEVQVAQTFTTMADSLAKDGKVKEAIFRYDEALRIDPSSVDAHIHLGRALLKQGNVAEAARHFSEALRLDPHHSEARLELDTMRDH